MNTPLSIPVVLIATLICGLIIFFERAFPFILFSKKEPPLFLNFIEKYIPPMVMAVLVIYCFKDIQFTKMPFCIPEFIAILVTIVLHLWKKNPMISIFTGTGVFMLLQNLLS